MTADVVTTPTKVYQGFLLSKGRWVGTRTWVQKPDGTWQHVEALVGEAS